MQLYTKFTVKAPKGTISEAGIAEIIRFMNSQRLRSDEQWQALNPGLSYYNLPPLPESWQWAWVVTAGDLVGTFPKRLARHYFKAYGIKCPAAFIQELGNIARRHTENNKTYIFEFVNRFDWSAGDFGDRGSCLWADRSEAREIMSDNGMLAIRFYDKAGNGFARAWVFPVDSGLHIVFNGYGFASQPTLTIARVLAQFRGVSYKKINLSNNDNGDGLIYINGGMGYAIAPTERLDGIYSYDFGWDTGMDCNGCGTNIDENDAYYDPNGNAYCQNCFYEVCDYCASCGDTYWRDDLTWIEGEYQDVCERCLNRHYSRCDQCEEYVYHRDTVTVKEGTYCQSCYERRE
jgi:hypothetical protein